MFLLESILCSYELSFAMQLQRNIRVIGNEELEMHPISAWKEAKLQFYGGPDGAAMQRRPLIHVLLHMFP